MSCDKPDTLTASLDPVSWFGSGDVTEIHTKENATCLVDRFSIVVRTDLPFDERLSKTTPKATGCLGPCTQTQVLGFFHIPLEKGTHTLALPDTCLPTKIARSSDSFQVGGKSTLHIMDAKTGRVRMYYDFRDGDRGWVNVTKLNGKNTGPV
ncbi:hypothetical protein GCM10027299_30990 [Larkinella ripae]